MKVTPKRCLVDTFLAAVLVLWACNASVAQESQQPVARDPQSTKKQKAMVVQYLEIVSADVNETCSALEKVHGVTFGEPVAALGNARLAVLDGGGRIGVRPPMRDDEEPVVRPYLLVEDIQAAVKDAKAAGGQFAMEPTEIPGHGTFAIYLQGGIQFGLWEQPSPFDAALADALGADERGMRSYVLVVLKTGPKKVPPGEERTKMFEGHMANIRRLAKEGKLVFAGPLDGVDGWRGIFVFATPDIATAKTDVATDPVIIQGEMIAEYHQLYGSAGLMMMAEISRRITKESP